MDNWPKPWDLLFTNLFEGRPPETSFELISEGLSASCSNADRLMSDVKFLIEAGKLSSARFLLATAREEIAKSHILVDCCRLDFSKHQPVLRKLCRAFYDHIKKYAYLEMSGLPAINDMAEARKFWDAVTERWTPAEPNDEEPDMPHPTCFNREFPLYIDYGDYERRWLIPSDRGETAFFKMTAPVRSAEETIEHWRKSASDSLCSPEVLTILNDVFKRHYIGDTTTKTQVDNLYNKVADDLSNKVRVSKNLFLGSPLTEWPLYHFV